MIQQSLNQGVLVPPLQGRVAAELDYGLVPDLLAAASVLDTPSPAPEDDCQLDVLGDITEEELHDFLVSQSPTSLLNDVSLAPETDSSTPRCVALPSPAVSVRSPSLPPSSVAAPLPPRNSDSGEPVAEIVNTWINSCKRVPFCKYIDRHFHGAGASEANLCFLYSFQAACYGLERDGLVNSGHWSHFCCAQKKSFSNGVLTREIDAFFIRAEGALDYLRLFQKVQKFSMTTVAELERNAPQHYVELCFALVANHDSAKQEFPVMIFDDYNESADPPCTLEPVCKLDWLKRVYTVYRVAAEVPKLPKKSKMSKKQRSRKKLKLCRK
eukprot:jgi/Phyca11/14191/fgenesh1_pg.PHYCAscaffold_6_\